MYKVYHRKGIVCLIAVLIIWLYLTIWWTKQHRISEYLNSSADFMITLFRLYDNLSIIYLTQNVFHKNQREISLNSDYMVISKNPQDKTQFTNLARQFMPRKYKFLLWAFEDATKLPRSYLLPKMRPDTDDRNWVCTRILRDVTQITLKLSTTQLRKQQNKNPKE